ncbi:uncharacterized protein RCC_09396 [Ramularia collo-cygni]|uniref:Uncharacterized protein n=1 Tax=Ramularia collo-cygni TaxID=112498 RepID=A0A2D3VF01_9PEZI|nr:uncharacterized protein RCC_09396 [Ramularia collo-cygni]CZT23682.1 uncharacterized protein RCC_09396 [Ramularia collo-cygni]
MNDDPLMLTIWQRLNEPIEQLKITKIQLQAAEEQVKVWKAKTWEKHKEMGGFKKQADVADQAVTALTSELEDAEDGKRSLAVQVEDLKKRIDDVMEVARMKIEDAKEDIHTLKTQNEALVAKAADVETQTNETKNELQTAKFELGIARLRAQTSDADLLAAKKEIDSLKSHAAEPSSDDGTNIAHYESRIELLNTQLQASKVAVEALQGKLQAEQRSYERLLRTSEKRLLDSRSVSSDLLHSYLTTDRTKAPEAKQPVIMTEKLRNHEWSLSQVEKSSASTTAQLSDAADCSARKRRRQE